MPERAQGRVVAPVGVRLARERLRDRERGREGHECGDEREHVGLDVDRTLHLLRLGGPGLDERHRLPAAQSFDLDLEPREPRAGLQAQVREVAADDRVAVPGRERGREVQHRREVRDHRWELGG